MSTCQHPNDLLGTPSKNLCQRQVLRLRLMFTLFCPATSDKLMLSGFLKMAATKRTPNCVYGTFACLSIPYSHNFRLTLFCFRGRVVGLIRIKFL